ncbi:MAG: hypothetical protein QG632_274 [Candidatus Dependentiae bacterium]|nr:hypothetical protein [Candidatus Dependentiae bacterium]
MKIRFFGLLVAVIGLVPVSTVGAIPRETIHNVSKYSLAGGALGALGFTGYIAYLNKAITKAKTPEKKQRSCARKASLRN